MNTEFGNGTPRILKENVSVCVCINKIILYKYIDINSIILIVEKITKLTGSMGNILSKSATSSFWQVQILEVVMERVLLRTAIRFNTTIWKKKKTTKFQNPILKINKTNRSRSKIFRLSSKYSFPVWWRSLASSMATRRERIFSRKVIIRRWSSWLFMFELWI